jgi:hypothetical protein
VVNRVNAPSEVAVEAVRHWLHTVVIGLNLCPFAAHPAQKGQVRFVAANAEAESDLLAELQAELERLDATLPSELETTLLVIPGMLQDFHVYNQFLDQVDALLIQGGWEGTYQVASFHPHYQFAGTAPDDAENLTNRAPYPILHIIREDSIDKAFEHYPDLEQIPERNILRMNQLSEQERRELFSYLL